MPNKFELMAEGVIEYKSRMEAAFGEWDRAGYRQISSKELDEAHALLKQEILDRVNETMAKCWWPERLRWRSFRKMFNRDLERQFEHFREFNVLRNEFLVEKQKHAEISALSNKLSREFERAESQQETEKLAELKEQIRLNKKIEEESRRKQEDLAWKLETLTKKFQLKFADKIDDYNTAHRLEKGGDMAEHLLHFFPIVGLVGGGMFAAGTLADYLRRSNNRKKQARKLDEAAEQQNEEDGMVKNDAKKASVGGIGT